MIIDKSTHSYLLECMYDKTTHKYYASIPCLLDFIYRIIDNQDEMKNVYESDREYYVDDLV